MQFLSNHDQDRIGGAFTTANNMKMAASLYLLSPGSPFIYYGEEIGIRGSRGSAMTDANRRLGMLWGDGDKVGNPVGTTYKAENQIADTVASELEDKDSILNHYSKLINVRTRYKAIARGKYDAFTTSNKNVAGFIVEYGGEYLFIVHNNSANEVSIDLSTVKGLSGYDITKLCETLGNSASLKGATLKISGYTSVILK